MCGIAGAVSFSKDKNPNIDLNSMKHRGPDGIGKGGSGSVSLAMCRLAIIDLDGGQQPLYNEDKKVEVIGNGEIYNYLELQKKLSEKHKLRTGSDIETVAHLYEDYGLKFVDHLRGMFALAILDKKEDKLILARDRFGEKPIYYYKDEKKFLFASELKTLIQFDGINKEVDKKSLDAYFHYYYIPEPDTPFKRVKKIPPASLAIIDIKSGKLEMKSYCSFSKIRSKKLKNPKEDILSALKDSCKLTLRSDVPVGISLSGGLDSSTIVALSAPFYKEKMKAFTIGYEGRPKTDERNIAKKVADRFGVEYIEKEISINDTIADFPKVVYYSDDPIADLAAYSIYSVSKLAKDNGIKVLLGGLGGDELFWGYPYAREAVEKNIKRKQDKFIFFDELGSFKDAERYIKRLLTREFQDEVPADNSYKYFENIKVKSELGIARNAMDLLREVWMAGDIIPLNDRVSMANSVELRSPLLDYKLAETAYKSKVNVLSYSEGEKLLLKEAMSEILPEDILELPKKGFTPPVASWLWHLIKNYVHLLGEGELVKLKALDKRRVNFLTKMWMINPLWWYVIYQLLVLEIWFRLYLKGEDYQDIKPRYA